MRRSMIWITAMGLALGAGAGRVAAEASPIATSMGDLRWGLSEREVAAYAKRALAAELSKAKDSAKQAKLKRSQSEVEKSLTSFQGGRSRWDSSPVAGEFTYDNGESMMVAQGDTHDTYFFFVNGRLWKMVKVFDKKSAGGDFKKFSQSIESKFGKGRVKKGEMTPGQGNTQWLEYLDRNSRMRAADSSGKRSDFAVVYEEMATVRELASTRPTKPSRLGGQSDEEESQPKNQLRAQDSSGSKGGGDDSQIAKAAPKRSVFGNERQQESDAEYQARKQKTAVEARERAQRVHERKEDAKKGEVLKQLDGLNDSDPLGGL